MDLSVIIVNYNVRHFLEQCLLSVYKAAEDIDCEIFVVDNNSADGSCSMIKREFPLVKLIMNNDNRGFAAANNQAIKEASGRFILLLNPDTIVEEDTFRRCINFMEEHPDAGAIGVRMIDGRGRLLPESKRALPTPRTAFFKIAGLSWLFPKSRFFNRYYLGHLDSRITTEADIISGAFMFLRKEAVMRTGLLDEDYFMYGEDIDYSYRLLKAGYKNYYYPEIRIIHYKGESTKKEDLNVMINFYKAMIIFVRKHFTNGSLKAFIIMIQAAIFLRAGLSMVKRSCKRIFTPITDGILIYFIYRIVTSIWQTYKFGAGYSYPSVFKDLILFLYTLVIIISVALLSGYKIPLKISSAIKGILIGFAFILVIYALLPLDFRFSRAIILFSGLTSVMVIPLFRILLSAIFPDIILNPLLKRRITAVVSDYEGYSRVHNLISANRHKSVIAGRVSIRKDDLGENVLGNIDQIKEIIRINRIGEIIFTTRELTAAQIIESMHTISGMNVVIRISPAGEKFIIGSKYAFPESI